MNEPPVSTAKDTDDTRSRMSAAPSPYPFGMSLRMFAVCMIFLAAGVGIGFLLHDVISTDDTPAAPASAATPAPPTTLPGVIGAPGYRGHIAWGWVQADHPSGKKVWCLYTGPGRHEPTLTCPLLPPS